MKFYLAPMEGLTGYIYRNTYEKFFGNIDKYFTPFITSNASTSLKTKELRDLLPENNKGLNIVPQILTNSSEGFLNTCTKLEKLGYENVNLNLGCPSGTVVSKSRGSGFLIKTEQLDRFLEEIFNGSNMSISIKTRLGKHDSDEMYDLLEIYNKYPVQELIVHPRTQKDFYNNKPNLQIFKDVLSQSVNPVCYNGDIFTKSDYDNLIADFPNLKSVMLGRGIIANPGLVNSIQKNETLNKATLRAFHDEIVYKYVELFGEEKNALYRMKEMWWYMIYIFSDNKKYAKKIKKSQNLKDYVSVIDALFKEQEIIPEAGMFYERD